MVPRLGRSAFRSSGLWDRHRAAQQNALQSQPLVDSVEQGLARFERRSGRGHESDGLSGARGLRPWRAGRDFGEMVPKPATVTISPPTRASAMAENTGLTAASAPALDMDVWAATRAASWALVIRVPSRMSSTGLRLPYRPHAFRTPLGSRCALVGFPRRTSSQT